MASGDERTRDIAQVARRTSAGQGYEGSGNDSGNESQRFVLLLKKNNFGR